MRTKFTILALALTLWVPTVAIAGWGAKGSAEPDTKLDSTGGWMFLTPDINGNQAVNKVYFNGFLGTVVGYYPVNQPTGVNPNVASAGSAIATYPDTPKAILGVWKDCNKDGYIGLGDNGLLEYRAELLLDTSVCPKGTIPPTIPYKWMPVHNDGAWVHEFLPLGEENRPSPATVPDGNPWNLVDEASRVWIDDGIPGSPPSGTCYTLAYPPGSFHSVGGMVSVADCYLTNRIDTNGTSAACAIGQCGLWASVKATPNPWGDESGGSYATVWDCSQPAVLSGPAVTNLHPTLYAPKVPPTTSTAGSPGGTMNATGSGLTPDCIPNYHSDQLNVGQQVAHEPYSYEADVNQINGVKTAPDFQLRFTEGPGSRPPPVVGASLGRGTPADGGTGELVYHRGFWDTRTVRAISRNPIVDRTLIAPQGVTIYTYYAFVSPTAITDYGLTLPKGSTTGTYGQEACGGATTGIVKQWACDPAAWYVGGTLGCRDINLGPGPDNQGAEYCARVGDPYDMRDIDCYDFSVSAARQAGVGYGVLTGTQCTPP